MDIGAILGVFIRWPGLALAPAALFAYAAFRCRRAIVAWAALVWFAYFLYELGMRQRILCSGECNIRVDLLLLYPFLALLTAIAVIAWARARRGTPRH